jgi:CheY-like chemotaxis protein
LTARLSPAILVCDCVSWRLDLFSATLQRLAAALDRWDPLADLRVGYRSSDDMAFFAVEPGVLDGPRLAAVLPPEAQLAGLQALEVPTEAPLLESLRDRLLQTCGVVRDGRAVESVLTAIRAALGMTDDRRKSLRLAVDVPVRYQTPGGWLDADAGDLSSQGVFVRTHAEPPEVGEIFAIDLWSTSTRPVRCAAQVARQVPGGFGARLSLDETAQRAIYERVRTLRPTRAATKTGRTRRVAVSVPVSFQVDGAEVQEKVENLSRGGAFIRSRMQPAPGEKLVIEVRLPKGPPINVEADVVRLVPPRDDAGAGGFGVSFREVTTRTQALIDAFIEESLAQPFAHALLAMASDPRRRSAASALAASGFTVVGAGSVDEAFERLIDELLGLDLLVLDGALPGTSAKDMLHRIRHLGGEVNLPVAIVCDAPGAECAALLAAGATEVFAAATPGDIARRCTALVSARRALATA